MDSEERGYISGTDILRPEYRGNRSEEEYVRYLKNYYEKYFPTKKAEEDIAEIENNVNEMVENTIQKVKDEYRGKASPFLASPLKEKTEFSKEEEASLSEKDHSNPFLVHPPKEKQSPSNTKPDIKKIDKKQATTIKQQPFPFDLELSKEKKQQAQSITLDIEHNQVPITSTKKVGSELLNRIKKIPQFYMKAIDAIEQLKERAMEGLNRFAPEEDYFYEDKNLSVNYVRSK